MSAGGVAGIARRDPVLPGLDVLLDADRLSDVLGREVRLTRVRYKPGSSVVVAFRDARGDGAGAGGVRASGWAASYTNDDKPAKTLRRATAERPVRRIAGLPHAIEGGVFADRALGAGFDALARRCGGLAASTTVLRHNPHRRALLAIGDHVVKVAAAAVSAPCNLGQLRARGVPVLVAEDWGDGVTATTRWGIGDLSERASNAHAELAGAALAALHRRPGGLDDAAVPASMGRASDVEGATGGARGGAGLAASIRQEMMDAAAGLAAIDPAFEQPARRLAIMASAAVTPAGRAHVTVHGDFSADQVLVGDGIRVIDFDRAGWGDPHRDLGSFFAAEVIAAGGHGQGPAMLRGYRAAGGSTDEESLRGWTAMNLLLRAAEPFRTARAGWPDQIRGILATAEGMLA